MKISIITVCRNSEKSIAETFESVLNQTSDDFEYIVIDGKSNDKTVEIIQRYSEKFREGGIGFRYITEVDAGIYDAMNKGIDLAEGEYLNFLNSDDRFYDENVLANVSKKLSGTDADILCGAASLQFENGENYIQIPHNVEKQLYGRMPFIHQSTFVKRKLMVENKFDLRYTLSADYDFFFKMLLGHKKFSIIDCILVTYSMDGASNKNKLLGRKEYKLIKKENMRKYNTSRKEKFICGYESLYYAIRYRISNCAVLKTLYIKIKGL
ncbi:MAG: glycosyltransferase [Lachnospiraceae bacterium]|nr:glycosyltransferase [Lachnospiraceae bacterium]